MAVPARKLDSSPRAPGRSDRPSLRVLTDGDRATADPGPTQHPVPELPDPGTRVVLMVRGAPWRHGAVMAYEKQWTRAAFPVRFDDCQWRMMSADLLVLESSVR